MSDVIQALGGALNNDLEAINHIAQNLANVNTPGYKSTSSVLGQTDFSESVLGVKSAPQVNVTTATVFNFANGALQQSKRSLDVAISGNAFFKVSLQGSEAYSRNGSLKINETGTLVNSLSLPLLTDQGTITFDNPVNIKIKADGSVLQNGNLLGKLELVNFKNLQHVENLGNGMLATPITNIIPAENWVINQGFIEASNVNTSQEMVRMMELSKHFESVQKALTIYDQALNSGITKLGQ